ncbi:MAG: MBL fold metallo-hydrolase [Muribaculaceae bacterium]|nr:MBL fold metallo-hydrolase [Muribaculaceae bacterium]
MGLKLKGFQCNMFGEITYIVWDEVTLQAAIVDAGMSNKTERDAIDRFIAANDLQIKYLLNTHIHFDHAFGIPYIEQKYGVTLSASPAEEPLASLLHEQTVQFHLPVVVENVKIDNYLRAGDEIKLGDSKLTVIDVPGHTPGGIAFYCAAQHFVLTGDSLFQGSIGRTDLYGGSHSALVNSVRDNLLTLPPETVVYPGHGPATTIGHERTFNPYL